MSGRRAVGLRLPEIMSLIGADPTDSDEARLERTLLVSASLMFILAGLLWGAVYVAFGEPLAGAVPLSYSAVASLSIVVFGLTRHYRWFRFTQLLLILCLPFLLQLALGGFVSSSAAVLWSLICPFGALLLGERRQAVGWFLAFLVLVVLGGVVQPEARLVNHLPSWLVLSYFVANIGAVSAIAFVLLHHFVGQEQKFFRLLRAEQDKSERLLQNVLPKEIAHALKERHGTLAEAYDGVSILFADMVGFTSLSDKMSPTEMVELLNDVFSHFDRLVEHYDLEKIRTIGDSYMVVAGAPRPRPDHAQALARLALDMRAFVGGYRRDGRHLSFRIGISSGPVVAGVIGRQKFHYDVWGDPVNMASRMESLAPPGRIQITRETYELIKSDFDCEPRGTVAVKGKGDRETWFLLAARDVQPERPVPAEATGRNEAGPGG
jgi:guanylate cyclase